MNVIKLVKDIWNGDVFKKEKPLVAQSIPVEHINVEIELFKVVESVGCLAKGLVESFKVEPDLWEESGSSGFGVSCGCWTAWKHSSKNYRISFYTSYYSQGLNIKEIYIYLQGEPANFTKEESLYVYKNLVEFIINPRKRKEEQEKQSKVEKENAYFVDLGCPKR